MDRGRAAVFLGGLVDALDPEAMISRVLFGREGNSLGDGQRFPAAIFNPDTKESLLVGDGETYQTLFRVFKLAGGLDGIVQGVSEQRA